MARNDAVEQSTKLMLMGLLELLSDWTKVIDTTIETELD